MIFLTTMAFFTWYSPWGQCTSQCYSSVGIWITRPRSKEPNFIDHMVIQYFWYDDFLWLVYFSCISCITNAYFKPPGGALMLAGQVHGWKSSTSGLQPQFTVSNLEEWELDIRACKYVLHFLINTSTGYSLHFYNGHFSLYFALISHSNKVIHQFSINHESICFFSGVVMQQRLLIHWHS